MNAPRLRLEPVRARAGDGSLDWTLRLGDEPAGEVSARCDAAEVLVSVSVLPSHRGRDVGSGAVGRLFGLAPFGAADGAVAAEVTYVLTEADDPDLASVGEATGFRRGDDGRWTRPAPRRRDGSGDVTRFLDAEGRIDRYPLRDAERRALLAWVAVRALRPGEVLTEPQVNERLAPFAPAGDVAVLRRYLIDAELFERTRSGSQYALVVDDASRQ